MSIKVINKTSTKENKNTKFCPYLVKKNGHKSVVQLVRFNYTHERV